MLFSLLNWDLAFNDEKKTHRFVFFFSWIGGQSCTLRSWNHSSFQSWVKESKKTLSEALVVYFFVDYLSEGKYLKSHLYHYLCAWHWFHIFLYNVHNLFTSFTSFRVSSLYAWTTLSTLLKKNNKHTTFVDESSYSQPYLVWDWGVTIVVFV